MGKVRETGLIPREIRVVLACKTGQNEHCSAGFKDKNVIFSDTYYLCNTSSYPKRHHKSKSQFPLPKWHAICRSFTEEWENNSNTIIHGPLVNGHGSYWFHSDYKPSVIFIPTIQGHLFKCAAYFFSSHHFLSSFVFLFFRAAHFCLFRAAPTAYGCSQARGWIGAVAVSPPHSHSNMGSEPPLRPTPQLMAMPDPYHWVRSGVKPTLRHPHGY